MAFPIHGFLNCLQLFTIIKYTVPLYICVSISVKKNPKNKRAGSKSMCIIESAGKFSKKFSSNYKPWIEKVRSIFLHLL